MTYNIYIYKYIYIYIHIYIFMNCGINNNYVLQLKVSGSTIIR